MTRSLTRGEWPSARRVCSSPGDTESEIREILSRPVPRSDTGALD